VESNQLKVITKLYEVKKINLERSDLNWTLFLSPSPSHWVDQEGKEGY
jgi:hypothetical protein